MDMRTIFRKGLSCKSWKLVDAYRKTGDVEPLARAIVEDPDILKQESMRSFISGVLLGEIKPMKDRPRRGQVERNRKIICFVEMYRGLGFPEKLSADYQGSKLDACSLAGEKFSLSPETVYSTVLKNKRRAKWWDVNDQLLSRWHDLGVHLRCLASADGENPESLAKIEALEKRWRDLSPDERGAYMLAWHWGHYRLLDRLGIKVEHHIEIGGVEFDV